MALSQLGFPSLGAKFRSPSMMCIALSDRAGRGLESKPQAELMAEVSGSGGD